MTVAPSSMLGHRLRPVLVCEGGFQQGCGRISGASLRALGTHELISAAVIAKEKRSPGAADVARLQMRGFSDILRLSGARSPTSWACRLLSHRGRGAQLAARVKATSSRSGASR
jgi:hypothetical protein